jgi:uncharacterized membrane protein
MAPAGAAPTPLATTTVDLRLWIHSNSTLSMASNANEVFSPASFTTRQWNMTDGLQKDLCVDLVDVGGGVLGFIVQLNVAWSVGFGLPPINVTVRVKDVSQTQVDLAASTFEFARSGPSAQFNNSLWNLPVATPRNCLVLKGHKLAVEISASSATSSTVATGDYRGAHLAFRATDPVLPTAFTANINGPASTFYPNDLEERRDVIVQGDLGNAFDSGLIDRVVVELRDPFGSPITNSTATLGEGNYSFTWHYSPSPAGAYTAFIEVRDTQSHSFNTSVGFVFAAFGLRMTAQGESGGAVTRFTTQGSPASFDLTVTNVGASATSVLMATETSPSPEWATDFSRNNFPLEAGLSNITTFRVTPSAILGSGNSTQVTVIAQAKDDPSAIKAKAALSTTTLIQPALVLRISPARTDSAVRPGEAAAYDFTVFNDGGLPTDVVFNATTPPEGWDRDLIGTGLVAETDGWRLTGLPGGGQQHITLAVSTPTSTANQLPFECTVSARAANNASAIATIVATTRLILGIELAQTSLPVRPDGKPSEILTFSIEVRNTDGLERHTVSATGISVSEASHNLQRIDGFSNGSISIFAPSDCCGPAQADVLTIVVQLPDQVRSGTYALTVNAVVDNDPNKVAQVNLSLTVNIVYDFSIVLALDDVGAQTVAMPEGTATLAGTIVNKGNTNVVLNLRATFTTDGRPEVRWSAKFTDASGTEITPAQVTVGAYGAREIRVVLQAPQDAFSADSRKLTLSLERTGGNPTWELRPPLTVTTSFSSSTALSRLWQQYFVVFLLAGGAFFVAGYLGMGALRGPKPPQPAAAAKPASAKKPSGSAAPPPKTGPAAAGPKPPAGPRQVK